MLRVEEATHRIALRVDERQREAIQAAASAAGVTMSEWVRDACTTALKAPEKPAERAGEIRTFMDAVRIAAERRG